MKKRRIVLVSILVLIILIIVAVLVVQKVLESNLDQLVDLKITNVPLAKVPDGTFPGHYAAFPIEVDLTVAVSGHQIKEIKLIKHVSGQGAPAEVITGHVVKAQSLDVDLVTGATYSSKVILKAVEDALSKASQ